VYPTADELAALLAPFDPERDELLRLLSRRVDDGMLREIAEADYGEEADAHEAALRRIRDRGETPVPIGWVPKEVLELIRWSQPDDPNYRGGRKGERGHRVRAFATAALLRAGAEPPNAGFISSENETLAQLLASSSVLGPDVERAALRFLAWRAIHFSDQETERPFFALAVLLAAVAVGWHRLGDEFFLDRLIDWVHAEERQAREYTAGHLPNHGGPWVLGLTSSNQRHDTWRELARRLLAQAESASSEWIRERLVEAGTWLSVPG
jgi:hypothetical protein